MTEDLTVTIEQGSEGYGPDLIKHLEKDLDTALVKNGFTRTSTTNENNTLQFNYRQFGKCL